MKVQKIKVNTKGGLLAAIECARGVLLSDTEIALHRKSGVTALTIHPTVMVLVRNDTAEERNKTANVNISRVNSHSRLIDKIKSKIRQISAQELLS